jgi:uncharacterized protein
MTGIRFTWSKSKDRTNQKKYGVSFEEAQTVFFDELALFMEDPDHSDDEDRFLLLGMSSSLRIILVCHCFRKEDEIIRIISARKANKFECEQYRKRQS